MKTKFGNAKLNGGSYYYITSGKEGNNGKLLHRLIFEEHYKCTLLPHTVIHHIDGNKLNNTINNLELMTNSEHSKLHNPNGLIFTEEIKKKMSENHYDISGKNNPNYKKTGINHHSYKNYPRIIKKGKKKGKQLYGIMFRGELIKCSLYTDSLEKWFYKRYPHEKLINEFRSN